MKIINQLLGISVGVASLTLITGTEAKAAQIKTDGTWYQFLFGDTGSLGTSCLGICASDADGISENAPDSPWQFQVGKGGAFLTIQDAFLSGDQFSAYNNGVLLGKTSATQIGADCDNDLLACISDPEMSKGKFFLKSGFYSLNILTDVSPYTIGAAFFQVSAVPEPTTVLGTLVFGGLGAGTWLKRRKKASK